MGAHRRGARWGLATGAGCQAVRPTVFRFAVASGLSPRSGPLVHVLPAVGINRSVRLCAIYSPCDFVWFRLHEVARLAVVRHRVPALRSCGRVQEPVVVEAHQVRGASTAHECPTACSKHACICFVQHACTCPCCASRLLRACALTLGSLNRGIGIEVHREFSQILSFLQGKAAGTKSTALGGSPQTWVLQKYIENPVRLWEPVSARLSVCVCVCVVSRVCVS